MPLPRTIVEGHKELVHHGYQPHVGLVTIEKIVEQLPSVANDQDTYALPVRGHSLKEILDQPKKRWSQVLGLVDDEESERGV